MEEVLGKVKNKIDGLPFNNLVAKVPGLSKAAKYANYIFCVLVVIVIFSFLFGGNEIDSLIDDYEYQIERAENLVEEILSGNISESEAIDEMVEIRSNVMEIAEKLGEYDDEDISGKQLSRILKLTERATDFENDYGF